MGAVRRLLGINPTYGVVGRMPTIARELLALNTQYYLRRRTPVLIFSMERTGTVALFQSLVSHGQFAIASHYLDPAKFAPGRRAGRARWASRHIIARRKSAKIISLVRNPVENMLSAFARSKFGPDAPGRNGARSAEEVSRQFLTEYLEKRRYAHHLTWFETEFRPALGIDVYKYPFDKERGFARFSEGPYDVLIVRTELENASKALAVGEFLGQPGFSMVGPPPAEKHDGGGVPAEHGPYGDIYRALKRRASIPDQYWEEITGSPYARHFFTEKELDESRERYGG